MKILVINGPNMNMLGKREKDLYGEKTLSDLENTVFEEAKRLGVETEFFQTNYEGAIVEKIQQADGVFDGIILNPAGYTHTSVAIRDAIASVSVPVIEVHVTNIFAREDFRSKSVTGGAARGIIAGLGIEGYVLALKFFADKLSS